ncbi:MAG: RICIN domain-containing protein [Saprospiraceae bacterium]
MKSITKISVLFLCLFVASFTLQATVITNQWVHIESKLNRLHLDVQWGKKEAGTPIWMFTPNTSNAQHWKLESAGGGYYYIKSRRSGLYLDVQGGSRKSGAFIWQYGKNGTDAQKWKPVPAGGGYYYLKAKVSGLYLDVRGGNTAPKTRVWQHPLNRTNAQKWRFKSLDGASDKITLPENLRPAFENIPVWRLQLRVKTNGSDKANTDSEVYVQLNSRGGRYYLDKGGNDREKNQVDTYDIVDAGVKSIRDIQFLKLGINGNDGWCVRSVELLVNNTPLPIYKKVFSNCHWLDGNSGSGPTYMISSRTLRSSAGWKHLTSNKSIWLPPSVIRRADLEKMVECYVGHMMNTQPKLSKLEFGKKFGRAYVEAKRAGSNKLHFDLDLKYDAPVDLETDVDFDLVLNCNNNQIDLKAQSVRAAVNVPVLSSILNVFRANFMKMNLGNFNFQTSQVPFCPRINVTSNGDVKLGI